MRFADFNEDVRTPNFQIFLIPFLLFALAIPSSFLVANAVHVWTWVPVEAKVVWIGERCEIQRNRNGKDSDWKAAFVTDCSMAEGNIKTNRFVLSNKCDGWRIKRATYTLVTFPSDGKLRGKYLPYDEFSRHHYALGSTLPLLHREHDYFAVQRALAPDELSVYRFLLYSILLAGMINIWSVARQYRRERNLK